jgi:hypothetical protein
VGARRRSSCAINCFPTLVHVDLLVSRWQKCVLMVLTDRYVAVPAQQTSLALGDRSKAVVDWGALRRCVRLLAAVFPTVERAHRFGRHLLRYFDRRDQIPETISSLVSLAAPVELRDSEISGSIVGFNGRSLHLVVVAAASGRGVFAILVSWRARCLRALRLVAVAAVVWPARIRSHRPTYPHVPGTSSCGSSQAAHISTEPVTNLPHRCWVSHAAAAARRLPEEDRWSKTHPHTRQRSGMARPWSTVTSSIVPVAL